MGVTLAQAMSAGPVVLDGGLSTHLETLGYDLGGSLWSARLLADDPEAIVAAHRDFFAVGAQVATSATYQASFGGFASVGLDAAAAADLMRRGVALAVRARDEAVDRGVVPQAVGRWAAASVGPYGAALADGSEYRGDYGLSVKDLRSWHRPRLDVLADSGADVLAIETIPCAAEVEALVAEVAGSGVPTWLSVSAREYDGVPCTAAGEPLAEVLTMAAGVNEIIAVGVNCCDPADAAAMLHVATEAASKPGVVYPNRGEPWDAASRAWTGQAHFDAAHVRDWLDAGAVLVGGCCRVEPDAIAAVRAQIDTL